MTVNFISHFIFKFGVDSSIRFKLKFKYFIQAKPNACPSPILAVYSTIKTINIHTDTLQVPFGHTLNFFSNLIKSKEFKYPSIIFLSICICMNHNIINIMLLVKCFHICLTSLHIFITFTKSSCLFQFSLLKRVTFLCFLCSHFRLLHISSKVELKI